MATDNPTPRDENEHKRAFDLRDDLHIKLAQARGICWLIRSHPDAKVMNSSISDSLWAVDELFEQAKEAVDELYQLTSTEKGVQS